MAYTISSMAQNTYSMFNFAANNGASLFGSSNSSKKTDSISAMWNNYANSQNSSYGINAANVYSVKSSAAEVLASHTSAKKEFDTEYKSTMGDLAKAVKTINSTDFKVGEDALKKSRVTTTDENGQTTTATKLDMSKELKTAVGNVQNLVDKYNDSIKFFNDNASLSNRLQNVSNSFKDTTYRSSNYASIGITVGSDGTMKVNEEQLAEAIVNSPDKVSRIMGREGLAGKAQSHMNYANMQQDKLFPSATSLFGSELKTAQAYTGSGMLRMNNYANVGNLFNMNF